MKYNIKEFIINICCFFIMFYIFNISIIGKICISEEIATILLITSVMVLIILGKILKLRTYQFLTLILIIIAMIMSIINNYYLKEDRLGNVVKYVIMLLFPFIILIYDNISKKFIKLIGIFGMEHIIGTIFVQIFKDFYLNKLLPCMSGGVAWVARKNFLEGCNPGLTSNYSMNGMYLSIAIIYFFSKYITTRDKKHIFFTGLGVVAILLTAKRGPLLFSILACVCIYFWCYKEKMSKKIINGFIVLFLGIISFFILSIFIPQLLNVVDRFVDSYEGGNVLNGRGELYSLAIILWKDKLFFGNGWGAFSYYFQEFLYTDNYLVKYIDAHNVYLQLLCEVGILGFLFYIVIMFKSLKISIKNMKKITEDTSMFFENCFSVGFQSFFLLYAITGNPLYDIQCYAIYFLCIGIAIKNYIKVKRGGIVESNNNIYTDL